MLKNRIYAFAKAGTLISNYLSQENNTLTDEQLAWNERITQILQQAELKNSWFTQDNLHYCLNQWSQLLTVANLNTWISSYNHNNLSPKTIAIIAAGNVPLVGLHDVLCALLTGHNVIIKASSNDAVLLPLIIDMAHAADFTLSEAIQYMEGKLEDYDAVIATGSNNTARYFEHYFGKKPNIIRKNRNTIAVLTGNETPDELKALSDDVFRYFGLGCRSVSHLKVPKDYNFDAFFKGMYKQRELINYIKYANNYDYNKAVYLMSRFNLLDNEFLILKEENESYSSPIASLGFSYYNTLEEVVNEVLANTEKLQCVVANVEVRKKITSKMNGIATPDICSFGTTQLPSLTDYADGIDTVKFLLTLS